MAGPGKTPKPADERRGHRTKAEKAVVVLSLVERLAEPPPLPEWIAEQACEETREWYEGWCRAPQASRFLSTDWQRLHMLAVLVDTFFTTTGPRRTSLMAEIRLNEALLGATPVDRRRLGWEVEPAEEPSKLDTIRKVSK